jgi:hypothetical protein
MINRFGSPVISMDCIRLLPIVSEVTIVSISFLQNTTTRQQYVVEFMAEHQMYTKEMGPTFINAKGKDCTSIDYILFQESYRDQISSIKKIDVIANVSDHYPILLRKAFSTSLAVSKVRSEDCIPSLTNSIYLSLSAVSHLIFVF